ncbi:MAG TPA: FeoC-like transcriptional regulator [Anaerolineae bacterium]
MAMLTELLKLLEQSQGELDLQVLSRQLGAEPSAVAGMVEMLVRKGRLVEAGATCGFCQACTLRPNCRLPLKRARQYVLNPKPLVK